MRSAHRAGVILPSTAGMAATHAQDFNARQPSSCCSSHLFAALAVFLSPVCADAFGVVAGGGEERAGLGAALGWVVVVASQGKSSEGAADDGDVGSLSFAGAEGAAMDFAGFGSSGLLPGI